MVARCVPSQGPAGPTTAAAAAAAAVAAVAAAGKYKIGHLFRGR